MKDRQLMTQLNKMKKIKPDRDWVSDTEQNILGSRKERTFSIFQFNYVRYAITAILVVAVIVGGVFYFSDTSQPQPTKPQLTVNNTELKGLISSLEQLSKDIDQTAGKLSKMDSKAASKAVQQGQRIAQAVGQVAKNDQLDPQTQQTVASLGENLEQNVNNLRQKLQKLYKKEAQRKLDRLQQQDGSLSEEIKEQVEQAEQLMDEEKYEQAFLKLEKISQ